MLELVALTPSNLDKIKDLYAEFEKKAAQDYKFENPPISFDILQKVIENDFARGYYAILDNQILSFLLYSVEEHRSYEISIIHTIDEYKGEDIELDLLEKVLEDAKKKDDWDVISYAMLGEQSRIVSKVTFLGFKLVGQAMVEFDLTNFKGPEIAMKSKLDPLPSGYSLDSWKSEYSEEISKIIYESFSTAPDAKFDPRFRSLEGCKQIINWIENSIVGKFIPECNTILLKNGKPVGVCLANLTNVSTANIPLVGLYNSEKGHKLSEHMLKSTVLKIITGIIEGRLVCSLINATVETDNFPAVRMYRKIGFNETYNYPQAYLNRSDMQL